MQLTFGYPICDDSKSIGDLYRGCRRFSRVLSQLLEDISPVGFGYSVVWEQKCGLLSDWIEENALFIGRGIFIT